jgi:hypothetical protein
VIKLSDIVTAVGSALVTIATLAGLGGLAIMAIKFLLAQIRGI